MNISIRLVREGKTAEDALKADHDLQEVAAQDCKLFIAQDSPETPPWLNLIQQFSSNPLRELNSQTCAAVLFINVELPGPIAVHRIMAIAFAGGFHRLNLHAFERSFGLRVALNCISRSNLRQLGVATLNATTFQRSIQSSRGADLDGFGVNVHGDLFRQAAGTPTDLSFARSLSGKDALKISIRQTPEDIKDKCQEALRLFLKTHTRKTIHLSTT